MKTLKNDLIAYSMVLTTPVVVLTIILASLLTSCGSDSSGGNAAVDTSETQENAPEAESGVPNSISIAKVADLPECTPDNDTQLAYVRSEKAYYFCENGSWSELDMVGKDGKDGKDGVDGQDGVTTVIEEEATNKKNQWVDPITGLEWLIGGGGDYAQAVAACSGDYRLPTWTEAVSGINHGVRAIAASVPTSTQNFWLDKASTGNLYYYATETAGLPNKFQVAATAGYNVFCVK
jgi:hypothetical protein